MYQILFIISILCAIFIINKEIKKNDIECTKSKLDKIGLIFNIHLSIFYVLLSMFSILLIMVSEGISTTNQLYINLTSTAFCILNLIPVICVISITLSIILRIKGKSLASFIIQFTPIAVFILNVSFLYGVEKWFN